MVPVRDKDTDPPKKSAAPSISSPTCCQLTRVGTITSLFVRSTVTVVPLSVTSGVLSTSLVKCTLTRVFLKTLLLNCNGVVACLNVTELSIGISPCAKASSPI